MMKKSAITNSRCGEIAKENAGYEEKKGVKGGIPSPLVKRSWTPQNQAKEEGFCALQGIILSRR